MFEELIDKPVSPLSAQYIATLKRPAGEYGLSLTMLGLACLKERVPNYNGISGTFGRYARKSEAYTRFLEVEKLQEENPDDIYYNYFINIRDDVAEAGVLIKTLEDEMTKRGYVHKTSVENKVKEKFECDVNVYYNTKRNNVAMFVSSRNLALYHLLLSFLPLYYPNIYTNGIQRDDPEVNVLVALSKQVPTIFKERLSQIFEQYREEFYTVQLKGMMDTLHKEEIHKIQRDMELSKERADTARLRYKACVDEYLGCLMKYNGALQMEQTSDAEKELIDFIVNNKEIRNVSTDNGYVTFVAATVLKQFDTDAWDIFRDNGNIFDGSYGNYIIQSVFENRNNRELLLNAIFSENAEFEVRMCGYYELDIRHQTVQTCSDMSYARIDPVYKDYVPNPHLQMHSCLGQFSSRIEDRLSNGDLITAMELCIHSAGSVNLDETIPTFRPFLGMILSNPGKILRRKDGVCMTTKEALLYLTEKGQNNDETD